MKLQEKFKAVELRKSGKSYRDILKIIRVSKSTLSLWLRDIELTTAQKEKLLIGRKKSQYISAQKKRNERIRVTKRIIEESKKEVAELINNPLFLSGLMLYWAEGDKSDVWEVVKFSNSDARMVKVMMRWFREICCVPEKKIRICLHIHALHCRPDIEKYWSKITKVPLARFYKTQIKPTSLVQRKNKLYNGTCAVAICDKNLFRKIKGWKLGFIDKMSP